MDFRKLQTPLVLAIGVLWTCMTVLAGLGHWFAGLFVLLAMLLLFLLLGATRRGRLDAALFACVLLFVALWALAFGLAGRHAAEFGQRLPDWTLLGFHPSFAWIVLLYWLAATVVLALGYYFLRRRWLSEDDWQEFLKQVQMDGGDSHE
jgi:hypothetical protein